MSGSGYKTCIRSYTQRPSLITRNVTYGGVVLQRLEVLNVCRGKTAIDIIAKSWIYFCSKNDLPQCLVVVSIVFSLLSSIGSLLSELSLSGFPLNSSHLKLVASYAEPLWARHAIFLPPRTSAEAR